MTLPPSPYEEKPKQQPNYEEQQAIPSKNPSPLTEKPSESLSYPPTIVPEKPIELPSAGALTASTSSSEPFTEKPNGAIGLPNSYSAPESPKDPDPFATFPKDENEHSSGVLEKPLELPSNRPSMVPPKSEEPATGQQPGLTGMPNGYYGTDLPSNTDPFATFPKDQITDPKGQSQPNQHENEKSVPIAKEATGGQKNKVPKMSVADFEVEEALFNR